ncbi:MAG: glycosyltransferase family 2 protein [Capsulimonadaceae bacterium]|nr:glycosyltransferase family 2 protein [Capsulimonadaceae bacterium]
MTNISQSEQSVTVEAQYTVSVVILTFNEAHRIRPCLESVKWADEVIVVDSYSTDDTAAIAREYTSNVYLSDLLGPSNPGGYSDQRNFGLSKATGDWVFFLDADERVTPELAREIDQRIRKTDEGHAAYRMRILNHYFGVPTPYTHGEGWATRIVRRGYGRYDSRLVHEGLLVDGTVGALSERYLHFSKDTVAQYVDSMNRYTNLEADVLERDGVRFTGTPWRSMLHAFAYRYIMLKAYKEGTFGLVMCLLLTIYPFLVWSKHWEHAKDAGEVPNVTGPSPFVAMICGATGSIWRASGWLKMILRKGNRNVR